jgi:VanZ family protein
MRPEILRIVWAVSVVALYVVTSLYPFHPIQWEWLPRTVANGAEWLPQGGIRFSGPGVARDSEPPGWVTDAMQSHQLQLSLQVRSFAPDQRGPARILTLSADPFRRNLTIAQDRQDLILRLRTDATDLNGTFSDGAPLARVPDAFRTTSMVDLQISIAPGRLLVEVGNELRASKDLSAEPLRTWDPSDRLALGNELTNDRPWLGEIRSAVVRVTNQTIDYTKPGTLELSPRTFRYSPRLFTLVPFGEDEPLQSRLIDAIINLVGYVPLGILLGLWGCRQGQSPRECTLRMILVAFVVSAGMETLQFGVATRHPSTTDVVLNTLGAGIGVLLALSAKSAGRLAVSGSIQLLSDTAPTTARNRDN